MRCSSYSCYCGRPIQSHNRWRPASWQPRPAQHHDPGLEIFRATTDGTDPKVLPFTFNKFTLRQQKLLYICEAVDRNHGDTEEIYPEDTAVCADPRYQEINQSRPVEVNEISEDWDAPERTRRQLPAFLVTHRDAKLLVHRCIDINGRTAEDHVLYLNNRCNCTLATYETKIAESHSRVSALSMARVIQRPRSSANVVTALSPQN